MKSTEGGAVMNTVERAVELAGNRSMSLFKLAEESGISYSTFQAAKRRGSQLSVDTIERICVYLDIPLYRFFKEGDAGLRSMGDLQP
ncbi:MAG: helix-turn-helix transcriptional regulator [Oscillospiraceae bacterium]|nr:helix-turn-helix transcriptional regulator [Oscillospiraceae bacterium]